MQYSIFFIYLFYDNPVTIITSGLCTAFWLFLTVHLLPWISNARQPWVADLQMLAEYMPDITNVLDLNFT